jgi:hypothetical protein
LLLAILVAAGLLAALAASNSRRLTVARSMLERAGPSEMLVEVQYGPNRACGGDFISVGFWQQGPAFKRERQGYVCGGLGGVDKFEPVFG